MAALTLTLGGWGRPPAPLGRGLVGRIESQEKDFPWLGSGSGAGGRGSGSLQGQEGLHLQECGVLKLAFLRHTPSYIPATPSPTDTPAQLLAFALSATYLLIHGHLLSQEPLPSSPPSISFVSLKAFTGRLLRELGAWPTGVFL